MRISKSWLVAAKDIRVSARKSYTLRSLVLFPIIIGIGLPLVLRTVTARHGAVLGAGTLPMLMNAFAFFLVIGAAAIPSVLAAYSLVGEKVEKSLEPLLASPVTDGELLLGKAIGSFIPSLGALYIGAIVFMVLSDFMTRSTLGYNYFPNWNIGLIALVLMPLTAALSVEWCVIVSARATDPRAAQFQGLFITLPLAVIYVATEVGAVKLGVPTLWILSAIMLVLDIALFSLSKRTFKREEILTRWT